MKFILVYLSVYFRLISVYKMLFFKPTLKSDSFTRTNFFKYILEKLLLVLYNMSNPQQYF